MSDARFSQLSKRIDEAWARVQAAQLAARDAEIGLLRAQLEESEAESALRLLEWGHTADELVRRGIPRPPLKIIRNRA